MPIHRIAYYLEGRLFEWAFSTCCVVLGIAMLIWPRMSRGSIVQVLVETIGGTGAAVVFLLVGLFSSAALIANGSSRRIGPRVRSISAIFRMVLWGQFTLAMIDVSIRQGFPSPMMFFFTIFTASELYVVYRAVLDVRAR